MRLLWRWRNEYVGLEISSTAALIDADIDFGQDQKAEASFSLESLAKIRDLAHQIRETLAEQSGDWKRRSIFEQQWLVRSFKQQAGRPVEQWLDLLACLETNAASGDAPGVANLHAPLRDLARYYGQLAEMAKGYVKDAQQREEQLRIVYGWQTECTQLESLLSE